MAPRHPNSFISLDVADHLLSDLAYAEFAAGVITVFAQRFICGENSGRPATARFDALVVAKTTQGPFLN
ncbi:MAG: hypothetical protein P8O03_03955 [Ilumatobacter sp.]|nr:hypothetical protein [Ilumatobacter sp.]MDG2040208.1 hypothetical protein [Ilumatobacter sp.]